MNSIFGNRIAQHVLFWVAQLVFYGVIYGSYADNYSQTFYEESIYLPVKIVFTYLVLYFLLPAFLLPGKYLQFLVWFGVASFLGGLVQRYIAFNFDYPIYYPEALRDPFMYFPKISKLIAAIYPPMFMAMAIKLLKFWYANREAQQILQQEKLEAELKFLKTQIHPHFLFNTLNNLYALTLKKSELAPTMVLKLSELINYMLYECRGEEVLLEKEIKFINNYVDIERLRYGDKLEVEIMVRGNAHGRTIAPLILLPFIENCFKHGASLELDQSWVKVDIEILPDRMLFKIENNKVASHGIQQSDGIGIANARRRLALIYPNRHELKILSGDETFLVILTINEQ